MINCKFRDWNGIKTNFATWLARLFLAAGGEPSSERYYMDKPLVTEACSDASDADNSDPLNLPHVFWFMSVYPELACFECLFLPACRLYFCVALPVGYCEIMFTCMHVRFLTLIGYREVLHGAVLSITGLTVLDWA